ncbi:UDP-galactopyranose/dTDP-fucopyranose mutase family protein [Dermacoccaceae bacterium W4C1]
MKFGIAGAGFSGAVIARELAEAGHTAVVYDTRDHVGGNCHTERDAETGVMVHKYGPHIFHTGNERVWEYVNAHGEMMPFNHRVRTTVGGSVYSLPVNLFTINQLFGLTLNPREAEQFVKERSDQSIGEPANFEEQALKFVGREIYEAFLYGYTRKQWGMEPRELPASVLKRLPVRFSYEDSYFNHPYQAIPRNGYTEIVASILNHPSIEVRLSTPYTQDVRRHYDHSIWSGPLDVWFDREHGRLNYRTLRFEPIRDTGDFQGTSVMNYGDYDVPFTRIAEHKHFAPWEEHEGTIAFREFSSLAGDDDIPYYPIRMASDKSTLNQYLDAARAESHVTFVGRLGTYQYLDMDVTIAQALDAADGILAAIARGEAIPSLFAGG